MARNCSLMTAARNLFCDYNRATNYREILTLPAWKILHQVPALKLPTLQKDIHCAFWRATITTCFWTGMGASFTGSGTRFKTVNRIVQKFGMAFLNASVATRKSTNTSQIAPSFR